MSRWMSALLTYLMVLALAPAPEAGSAWCRAAASMPPELVRGNGPPPAGSAATLLPGPLAGAAGDQSPSGLPMERPSGDPFPLHCARPPASLVSWWPGDGKPDDIVSGYDGVLQSWSGYAPGLVNQAFALDGWYDKVYVPHVAAHNPPALTVEAWFRYGPFINGWQRTRALVKKAGGGQDGGYSLELNNGTLGFWLSTTAGWRSAETAATLSMGTWYHAVGTYDGSSLGLYLNGTLVASTNVAGLSPVPSSGPLYIGGNPFGLSDSFAGLIDEVRVYARALSLEEIQRIFAAGADGACQMIILGRKSANRASVRPGEPVTYQIELYNTESSVQTGVRVTDTLPAGLTYMPGSLRSSGGTHGEEGGVITWTGSIEAAHALTVTFGALAGSTLAPVQNTAFIEGPDAVIDRSVTVDVVPYRTFMPAVSKSYPRNWYDNFSNPNTGWANSCIGPGTCSYYQGEYQMISMAPSANELLLSTVELPTTEFDVEVEARAVDSTEGSIGVVWGDVSTGHINLFLIHDDMWNLCACEGKYWATDCMCLDAEHNAAIRTGNNTNRLRVALRSNGAIRFYANDRPLTGYAYQLYGDMRSKDIGLVAGQASNFVVRFDNFRIGYLPPGNLAPNGATENDHRFVAGLFSAGSAPQSCARPRWSAQIEAK